MDIETLRTLCISLESVTEDIKWDNDLCFSIGGKMFCVTSLQPPFTASLKVKDEEFEELCQSAGIEIAPYVGRYKWILVTDPNRFTAAEWQHYVSQSYTLVKAKLPKKKAK